MKHHKWTSTCLTLLLSLLLTVASTGADDRVIKRRSNDGGAGGRQALVIGNGGYRVGPLRNPPADARLIADTLEDMGFSVSAHTDLDFAGMNRTIDRFGRSLKGAGTGLFYFAGHGVQFRGRNYLMPVDADVQAGNELRYRAVDAGLVMAKMESAGNPVNVVILDACRNNPFARSWRSPETGLAQMDAPPGAKIIYATRPGDVAKDGDGNHSPFTKSLAEWIKRPGKELEQVIRGVYRDVYRQTGGEQSPWAEGILVRDVFLARSSGAQVGGPGKGLLTVRANAPGATVWLDDREYGETPRTFDFDADAWVRVRVTAEGYAPYEKRVRIKKDEDEVVTAILEKKAVPAPITQPAASGDSGRDRFVNSLGMEFVRIPAGSFMMGSPPDEPERNSDEQQHRVTLTNSYYIGITEVTQAQWKKVMGNNPSFYSNCGGDCPVEEVSWSDVQEFIENLNRRESKNYRLPTEAEWEYAARAGTLTAFAYGRCLSTENANYDGNNPLIGCPNGKYVNRTVPVGSLKSTNAWGLHDIHGNVWEWCQDRYGEYPSESFINPKGSNLGSKRVLRGGGWANSARYCRSALRGKGDIDNRYPGLGFRLAFSAQR